MVTRALLLLVTLLLPAPAAAQAGTIILARHAEKAAPSGDPELTPEGRRRAEALAQVVADVRLTAILTTQFRRTGLTAAPAKLTSADQALEIAGALAAVQPGAPPPDSRPEGGFRQVLFAPGKPRVLFSRS